MRNQKGFTLIELMIVIAIVAIIAAIAIPNLLEARKSAHETSAIGSLRTIFAAQSLFREQDKDKSGTLEYAPSLYDLHTHGELVDETLGRNAAGLPHIIKQGYHFISPAPSGPPNTAYTWSCIANPFEPGKSGNRYFYVDDSGVIRFSTTGEATAASDPVGDGSVPVIPVT